MSSPEAMTSTSAAENAIDQFIGRITAQQKIVSDADIKLQRLVETRSLIQADTSRQHRLTDLQSREIDQILDANNISRQRIFDLRKQVESAKASHNSLKMSSEFIVDLIQTTKSQIEECRMTTESLQNDKNESQVWLDNLGKELQKGELKYLSSRTVMSKQ